MAIRFRARTPRIYFASLKQVRLVAGVCWLSRISQALTRTQRSTCTPPSVARSLVGRHRQMKVVAALALAGGASAFTPARMPRVARKAVAVVSEGWFSAPFSPPAYPPPLTITISRLHGVEPRDGQFV